MRVFDVVEIIERGAATSALPGRWLVDHFADEGAARDYAARCNQHRTVIGIRFEVEDHEELSPLRAISRGDFSVACFRLGVRALDIAGTPEAETVIRQYIADNQQ